MDWSIQECRLLYHVCSIRRTISAATYKSIDSNGATIMLNTFTMQELIRRSLDEYAEDEAEFSGCDALLSIQKGRGVKIHHLDGLMACGRNYNTCFAHPFSRTLISIFSSTFQTYNSRW
jgi:hypothetical protein